MSSKILVIGAAGQIGTELTLKLREIYGVDDVIATDIKDSPPNSLKEGPYEKLDILNKPNLYEVVQKYRIKEIYHLAALLSATAENNPALGWDLNMNGLSNVLDLSREGHIQRIFWPSSIAVFGPNTPKDNTPQRTIMEPTTVYGITKVAGESWCEYYHNRYKIDIRSVRFPGIVGYKSAPGGGTTDYAVHIFHEALKRGHYDCFLSKDTELPMMFMTDAIKSILQIMDAPSDRISVRTSYNISGFSFTPETLSSAIQKEMPEFSITYNPDYRDAIAKSWPSSLNDSVARNDWNWSPGVNLKLMVNEMLVNLRRTLLA